jgi:hypothetical protein
LILIEVSTGGLKMKTNYKTVYKELRLILNIIKEHYEPDMYDNIDWKLFIELVVHHRLFSNLYPKIKMMKGIIPEDVMKTLQALFKQNTYKMLQLSGEMVLINKLFILDNVPLIILKGPVLGQDLYGDISLRTSSDLDVLVPLNLLEQAESILINQGYIKDDYIKTILNDWKWRHHHVTYKHPKKGVKVELHWRLNPGPGKEPSFSELWNRKRNIKMAQEPIYILGREDLFFFLSTHGARHAWSRLRWLLDIHQLLQQDLDWTIIHRLFKQNQFIPVGSQAIMLSSEIYNTDLPKTSLDLFNGNLGKRLANRTVFYFERMVNLHSLPVPVEVSNYHSRYLFSILSWQHKCKYLLSLLYPLPEDAEVLPLPKWLHLLYFPLKPFLWIKRKLQKPGLIT